MKRVRLLIVIGLLLLSSAPLFSADAYSIESLQSVVKVSEEGLWDVAEEIVMNFQRPMHGFYRILPVRYDQRRVRVSKLKASEKMESSYGWGYLTLKVGRAEQTVTGRQTYNLSYRYNVEPDASLDYDEFYFNLVGEGWEVPIERYSFRIEFPQSIANEMISFTIGEWGSTTSEGVTWSLSADGRIIEGFARRLLPSEALTVRVQMEKGYYKERFNYQGLFKILYPLVTLLGLFFAWLIWHLHGRDKDLIVVPQFKVPPEMSPLDVGYLIDSSLDPRDVTAMLFYWADKGCLSIVEEKQEFTFIRGYDPVNPSKHEKKLFEELFSHGKQGVVKAQDLKGEFASSYQKVKRMVEKHYTKSRSLVSQKSLKIQLAFTLFLLIPAMFFALAFSANFMGGETVALALASLVSGIALFLLFYRFDKQWFALSRTRRVLWGLLTILLILVATLMLSCCLLLVNEPIWKNIFWVALTVGSNIAFPFLAVITKQRSAYGRQQLELVLGLKDFIEKVELDQLKRMIDEDSEFYYHLLSFAIVLNLEKKWAKKFGDFTLERPSWYSGGRVGVWDAVVLSSLLSRTTTAMSGAYTKIPTSSPTSRFGGSSFGGGGFSGGGFGGGGGGAW